MRNVRKTSNLAGDIDSPDVGSPSTSRHFGHSDSENPIMHGGLELIYDGIVWDLEPGHELAALDTHLEDSVILKLNQNVLVHEPRNTHCQHVGPLGFPPIEPGVDRSAERGVVREGECGE